MLFLKELAGHISALKDSNTKVQGKYEKYTQVRFVTDSYDTIAKSDAFMSILSRRGDLRTFWFTFTTLSNMYARIKDHNRLIEYIDDYENNTYLFSNCDNDNAINR